MYTHISSNRITREEALDHEAVSIIEAWYRKVYWPTLHRKFDAFRLPKEVCEARARLRATRPNIMADTFHKTKPNDVSLN